MKNYIIILLSFIFMVSSLEVDIDKLSDNKFKIFFDNIEYNCDNKPPLSHSWSYECRPSATRSINSTRYLRIDCDKCYRECGGEYPVLFSDAFCSNCIDECY